MNTRILKTAIAALLTLLLMIPFIPTGFADDTPAVPDTTAAPDDAPITVMAVDSNPAHFNYHDLAGSTTEVTGYTGTSTQISIPATSPGGRTVVGIGDGLFTSNASLTSISMPNSSSFTYIGYGAFNSNLPNLASVTLNSGLLTIKDLAFAGCGKLTGITLPSGLTTIGNSAFQGSGLTSVTIPNSVTTIGYNVFKGCTSLVSAAFSGNFNSLPEGMFWGDTALASVTFPGNCKTIERYAFQQSGITSITLPSGLTDINFNAFNSCSHLASITFPATLKTIGEDAFAGCGVLNNVVLPASLTTLSKEALCDCYSLTNITFADNIKLDTIGQGAFTQDPFTSITLPDYVTTISANAFDHCWALQNITLSDNVTYIGNEAFKDCYALKRIKILDSTAAFGTDVFKFDSPGYVLNDPGNGICGFAGSTAESYDVDFNFLTLHKVTFNHNNSTNDEYQYPVNNEHITEPAPPTKPGYAFDAWYFNPECTQIFDFTDEIVDQDRTLYANWVTPYHVTYNGNSATGGTVPTDTNAYASGHTVTVLGNTGNLTKTGFAFIGWNTVPNGSGVSRSPGSTFTMPSIDQTLYTLWAQTYTVTYEGNGSTGGAVPTDANAYISGATVTLPGNTGNLTNTGYTFAGWNTLPGGTGTNYTPGNTFAMPSGNQTLYAKWVVTHTVTFDSQKGSAVAPQPVGDGLTANEPTPTRSGYTFEGWYTDTSYATQWNFSTAVTADMTLYAKWTAVSTYLKRIDLTPGASFTKSFSKTKTSYTVNLTEDTDSVTLTPVPENSHATVAMTYKDGTVINPGDPVSLPNKGDSKTVKIKVTMSGKSSHTYTLTVTRAKSSYNQLYNIYYDAGIGDKTFDPGDPNYTITLGENTPNVTITPALDTSNPDYSLEKIYIDGKLKTSKPYTLKNTGDTVICKIKIVAQNGTPNPITYKVTIKRAPSTDADLKGLKTNSSSYPIDPIPFDKYTTDYTVKLSESKSSIKLTATKDNGYASVTFIDGAKQYKSSSHNFSIANGAQKDVIIRVTAQDKTTVKDYTVHILRAPAISSFSASPKYKSYPSLSPGSYNNLTFTWAQKGAGHIKIEEAPYGTTSWSIVGETDESASGTYTYDWNGWVGGSNLPEGTYTARIQVTSASGDSLYKTLTFKILPIAPPTISVSLSSIPHGGTQSTDITITWSVFSKVSVIVYDTPPHSVATIMPLSDYLAPGTKTLHWDGTNSGVPLDAGDYVIRVTSGYYAQDVHVTITP